VARVNVSSLDAPLPAELPFEIVERKGVGHPDTICDALAENLSIALSRHYLERFGTILHHNVDKALLVGGAARPAFGGGELDEPIEITLAGRATREFRGVQVPIDAIAVEASHAWLRDNLRHLDSERQVRIVPRIRPTSPDLAALFLRQGETGVPLANDTSIGVGFAPLDELERTVLAIERRLNSAEIKRSHPEIGEDIKVMGVRSGARLRLTVACAMVGRHLPDLKSYFAAKAMLREIALAAARDTGAAQAEVEVNTADGDTADSVYLTVTGLSAEAGDDGQVGRGNRVSGLITPFRPMTLEAAAGKNPLTHVGKLYNLLAQRIAHVLVAEVAGLDAAQCFLVSQIGRPIAEPQIAEVKLRPTERSALQTLAPHAAEAAAAQLSGITELWREIVASPQQAW